MYLPLSNSLLLPPLLLLDALVDDVHDVLIGLQRLLLRINIRPGSILLHGHLAGNVGLGFMRALELW